MGEQREQCVHCGQPWGVHWAPSAFCEIDSDHPTRFSLVPPLTELEREVVEAAIAWRYQACSQNKVDDALWESVNRLLVAREGKG